MICNTILIIPIIVLKINVFLLKSFPKIIDFIESYAMQTELKPSASMVIFSLIFDVSMKNIAILRIKIMTHSILIDILSLLSIHLIILSSCYRLGYSPNLSISPFLDHDAFSFISLDFDESI